MPADAVSVDNVKGVYAATQQLIAHGHTRIAIREGLPGTYANTGRVTGYRQGLVDAEIPVREEYIVGDDFGTLKGSIRSSSCGPGPCNGSGLDHRGRAG